MGGREGLSPILNREDGELAVRRLEGETGEGGGGISVLRADRGVPLLVKGMLFPKPKDCRALLPPGVGMPTEFRVVLGALGVVNGDATFDRVGLPGFGLSVPFLAFCSCCAVIPTYLLARDPAVKLGSRTVEFLGFAVGVTNAALGVTAE